MLLNIKYTEWKAIIEALQYQANNDHRLNDTQFDLLMQLADEIDTAIKE